MDRVRPAETATIAVVAALGIELVLFVAAIASLGKVPVEAFHRAMLGVAGLGVVAAAAAEAFAQG